MSVRTSQVFAAQRTAIIKELQMEVSDKFLPNFNAEVFDIRKSFKDNSTYAIEQPDTARNKLLDLGEARKKARILDLVKRKNDFLSSLKIRLGMEIKEKIEEFNGEVFEEEERIGDTDRMRRVTKVKFPDKSVAKVPTGLYIDYSAFDRV